MTVTVYIDELILQNCIICFLIFLSTGRLSGARPGYWRLFFVSLLSGGLSAAVFFLEIPDILSPVLKLAVSGGVVFAAFGFGSIKRYLKRLVCFFVLSLGCAAVIYVIQLAKSTDRLGVSNLTVYIRLSPVLMFSVAGGCYLLVYLISLARPGTDSRNILPVELSFGCSRISVAALADTGNTISDLYGGHQVIICSSADAVRLFGGRDFKRIKGYRLIPCSTVGGSGYLSACLADSAVIYSGSDKHVIISPLIAVSDSIDSGDFSALLGADVLKEINYDRENTATLRKNIRTSRGSDK